MASLHASLAMAVLLLGSSSLLLVDSAAPDTAVCSQVLQQLLPCLPYVQGKADIPTSGCCSNLKTVHENNPACLCELIAASVSGNKDLPPINTTLSLNLAPMCNVVTHPRRCPELLGISASSPEAKIFETGAPLASPAGSPAEGPSSSTSEPGGSMPSSGSSTLGAGHIGILVAVVSLALCVRGLYLP